MRTAILAAAVAAFALTIDDAALAQSRIEKEAIESVKQKLKDPFSAQFRGVTSKKRPDAKGVLKTNVCGEVNSKNSYGAYVGFEPFVYLTDLRQAFIWNYENRDQIVEEDIVRRFCL